MQVHAGNSSPDHNGLLLRSKLTIFGLAISATWSLFNLVAETPSTMVGAPLCLLLLIFNSQGTKSLVLHRFLKQIMFLCGAEFAFAISALLRNKQPSSGEHFRPPRLHVDCEWREDLVPLHSAFGGVGRLPYLLNRKQIRTWGWPCSTIRSGTYESSSSPPAFNV